MRYKIRHSGIHVRGANSKEQWENLRSGKKNKEYCIESEIDLYERNCNRNLETKHVAEILTDILGTQRLRIASFGVGKAQLEWHLKQMNPMWYICCTDYTGKALIELQKVFPSCNKFLEFDMLKDDWECGKNFDFVLLNRVNSEFNFAQWQGIYRKMAKNKINRVIFIPSRFGSVRDFCLNLQKPTDMKYAKTSWCYTEHDFLRMWKKYYKIVKKISINDSAIYFLEIKNNR